MSESQLSRLATQVPEIAKLIEENKRLHKVLDCISIYAEKSHTIDNFTGTSQDDVMDYIFDITPKYGSE